MRSRRRLEVAEAIAAQGLTMEELAECIEMGSDFCWGAPLSRLAAIDFLNPQPDQHQSSESQAPEQQVRHQASVRGDQVAAQTLLEPSEPSLELQLGEQRQGEASSSGTSAIANVGPATASTEPVAQKLSLLTTAEPVRPGCFEAFAIDSDESDGIEAPSDIDADADDAYWLSELCSNGVGNIQPAVEEQNGSPSDDGDRPAKRHRPG